MHPGGNQVSIAWNKSHDHDKKIFSLVKSHRLLNNSILNNILARNNKTLFSSPHFHKNYFSGCKVIFKVLVFGVVTNYLQNKRFS